MTTPTNDTMPPIVVRAQYIRDLSFENPNPVAAFTMSEKNQPSISVNIQAKAQDLGESNFEVVLEVRIDAKQEDDVMFIVELSYGGIVTVGSQIPKDDVHRTIMVQTPYLLFPFARNVIADMTRDSGYPPLLLAPVDFDALYDQQQSMPQEESEHPTQH